MKHSIVSRLCLPLLLLVSVACTPVQSNYPFQSQSVEKQRVSHDNGLSAFVGSARVGVPQTFVDSATGLTSTVTVNSTYFSANGRQCRRFTQHLSNAAVPKKKLACADRRTGWREINLSNIHQG